MRNLRYTVNHWYRQWVTTISRRFLSAARHPYAFLPFALLATTDSILLILPAELMAITLMIIQPHRARTIGVGFAIAAAVSALILALVILEAKSYSTHANPALAEVLESGSILVTQWGAPALALLSIFPDSPRASIAVATLAGISPPMIAACVLAGKLLLYAGISHLLQNLPQFIHKLRHTKRPVGAKIYARLRRLAAFQRLLRQNKRRPQSKRD